MAQKCFQFRLKPNKTNSTELINKMSYEICNVWYDIEYLLEVFNLVYIKFNNQAQKNGNRAATTTLQGLAVLGRTFYIYLDIIRKLFEDAQEKEQSIKEIYKQCRDNKKDLLKRIRIVRNHIIIHREKNWSYDTSLSSIGTGPEAQIEFGGTYKDNNGNNEDLRFSPIEDVNKFKEFLNEFKEKYNLLEKRMEAK